MLSEYLKNIYLYESIKESKTHKESTEDGV